jgi:hypothetical protein
MKLVETHRGAPVQASWKRRSGEGAAGGATSHGALWAGRAEESGKVRRASSHFWTRFPVARASCPGRVTAKMSVPHQSESLLIFRLTSHDRYDSLLPWSFCGQFVAAGRRASPGARESGRVPAMGERRDLQKMKNSGNEAKKYLKTKNITFLKGANFARFVCKLRLIWS